MALPELRTPRLRLRPRRMADLEACFAMDREPGTLAHIDWPEETGSWDDREAHRAFIRRRIKGPYPRGQGYWVIERQDDPDLTFLGWVLLIPLDETGPETEIGWRIPRAHRGQGLAPEAAAALLAYGFANLGLVRIVADIYPQNGASCRVAEKIGMQQTSQTPSVPGTIRYLATLPCKA